MITKILTLLKSNCYQEDSGNRNRIAQMLNSLLNMFVAIILFLVALIALAFAMTPLQYLVPLGCSIVFLVLYLLGKKLPLKTLSVMGLIAAISASLGLQYVFPTLAVFSVLALVVPIYAVCAVERNMALIITIVFLALHGVVLALLGPTDPISMIVFAGASVFACFMVAICIEFCNMILHQNDESIAALDNNVKKKQEFISKLSHRIRTPLSNILGIANIISENNEPAKKQQLIDSLIASVKTITDIVEIIDEESAGASGGSHESDNEIEEISTFDLQQLITQTGEFTQNLEVKLEVHGQLPKLKGNAVKIRRIFLNVFDFFLQHTPKDKLPANVTIAVNRVRIPINPVKYRFDIKSDIVMDDFSEADVSELVIAKRLIENLHGSIKRRIDDDMTCIYFNICFEGEEELPAANAAVSGKVVTNETTGYTSTVKQKDLSEVNVMVCDDNPINQKVMSLSLEKHVKSISLAANGQECVDMLARNNYDVVLMDIQMPVLDGYAATQKIRNGEISSGKHVPIIAVTANTLAGDKQHCLSVGMDDYVSKPFQLEDVLNKMRELIAKYPQA